MQDLFVYLVILLVGAVAIDSTMSTRAHVALLGALAGVAFTAKYMTMVYTLPLIVAGMIRLPRLSPGERSKRFAILILLFAIVSVPWLLHVRAETGNPLFPLLSKTFDPPLWPAAKAGTPILDPYKLAPGFWSRVTAPYDATFHSERFVEGSSGFLGLALLTELLLVLPVLRDRRQAPWIIAAFVGTLCVFLGTGNIRYWVPAVILLAPAAAEGAAILSSSRTFRVAIPIAVIAMTFLQIPVAMANCWDTPTGWPWNYYTGAVTFDEFLGISFDAPVARRGLEVIDPDYPRVWVTGAIGVGHWRVVAMEAHVWEFAFHGAKDRASIAEWLEGVHPDYWVVESQSAVADQFAVLGLDAIYWRPEYLVASQGPIKVYRFASSARATASVRNSAATSR
jgi:hypothetical protein